MAAGLNRTFSIRGYVARIRSADAAQTWPFGGEVGSLPPLTSPLPQWWSCELDAVRSREEEAKTPTGEKAIVKRNRDRKASTFILRKRKRVWEKTRGVSEHKRRRIKEKVRDSKLPTSPHFSQAILTALKRIANKNRRENTKRESPPLQAPKQKKIKPTSASTPIKGILKSPNKDHVGQANKHVSFSDESDILVDQISTCLLMASPRTEGLCKILSDALPALTEDDGAMSNSAGPDNHVTPSYCKDQLDQSLYNPKHSDDGTHNSDGTISASNPICVVMNNVAEKVALAHPIDLNLQLPECDDELDVSQPPNSTNSSVCLNSLISNTLVEEPLPISAEVGRQKNNSLEDIPAEREEFSFQIADRQKQNRKDFNGLPLNSLGEVTSADSIGNKLPEPEKLVSDSNSGKSRLESSTVNNRKEKESEHVQTTMRLMGKDVSVSRTGTDQTPSEDGMQWTDKEIISEQSAKLSNQVPAHPTSQIATPNSRCHDITSVAHNSSTNISPQRARLNWNASKQAPSRQDRYISFDGSQGTFPQFPLGSLGSRHEFTNPSPSIGVSNPSYITTTNYYPSIPNHHREDNARNQELPRHPNENFSQWLREATKHQRIQNDSSAGLISFQESNVPTSTSTLVGHTFASSIPKKNTNILRSIEAKTLIKRPALEPPRKPLVVIIDDSENSTDSKHGPETPEVCSNRTDVIDVETYELGSGAKQTVRPNIDMNMDLSGSVFSFVPLGTSSK